MSFTGWLRIYRVYYSGSIYHIRLWLVNQTHTSTKIDIIQVNGDLIVYSDETSLLPFTPQSSGWAGNITVRVEFHYNAYCTLYTSLYYNYTQAAIGELKSTLNIKSS